MQSLKTVNYAYRQTDVHLDHSIYYKILIKYIVYCIVLYCIALHCLALHYISLSTTDMDIYLSVGKSGMR